MRTPRKINDNDLVEEYHHFFLTQQVSSRQGGICITGCLSVVSSFSRERDNDRKIVMYLSVCYNNLQPSLCVWMMVVSNGQEVVGM